MNKIEVLRQLEESVFKKKILYNFSENRKKSQKTIFFFNFEKWDNDEKMPPMVIFGPKKV